MNLLSHFVSRGPSAPARKGIATVSPGEFYIVRREDSPRGHRELIFKEAELSLTSTSREFVPQLQVTEIGKEEEAADTPQPIEPDELEDSFTLDENIYLVHPDIKIGYYRYNGRVAIAWQDIEGDEGDHLEFLCSEEVVEEAFERFDRSIGEALYGQKYGTKPPANVPSSVFDEFLTNYETKSSKAAATASASVGDEPNADTAADTGSDAAADNSQSEVDEGHPYSEGRIMASAKCGLCVYDSAMGVFNMSRKHQSLTAVILDQTNYKYFLEVRDEKKAILGVDVSDDLNQFIDGSNSAIIFNCDVLQSQDDPSNGEEFHILMSYLLKFEDLKTLYEFEEKLAIAQYEARNRSRWSEVPADEQDFLIDAVNGVRLDEPGDQDQPDGYSSSNQDENSDDDMDLDVTVDSEYQTSSEKNSALEVGHVNDRTFVVRGNKIGVFKNTNKDLKYSTTIDSLEFDPDRIMLHEQDRALLLHGKNDPNSIYRMDLETGKIVDEWDTGRSVVDFNPVSKFAPTTGETNLYGVANQSVFRIDPRITGGRVDPSNERQYKKKVGLSHVVTTADGRILVGNNRGELRLYDQVSKDATSLIPGLGVPFVGLDVTSDGKWALATCERFILLIPLSSTEKDGVVKFMRKRSTEKPYRLTITPANAAFMHQQSGKPLKFTPARFNTGLDAKEATIVTSTGPYLVIWNLNKVLRGEVSSYRIKKYTSEITSENFKFGTDQRVILTLDDDVDMVAKSSLRNPDTVFKAKTA